MKKLIILFLCMTMFLSLTACGNQYDYSMENYESRRETIPNASYYLPTLEALGDYERINYSYQRTPVVIFEAQTITLFVEYSPAIYKAMKTTLLSSGDFLTETLYCDDSYASPPPQFTYKDYLFKTADGVSSFSCKNFAVVGMNDEKCRIVFCYFYDIDLDHMGTTDKTEQETITEFMDEYFAWNDFTD